MADILEIVENVNEGERQVGSNRRIDDDVDLLGHLGDPGQM